MSKSILKSTGAILVVFLYRFVYNVTGCYFAARFAPNKPMKHVLIIGVSGHCNNRLYKH